MPLPATPCHRHPRLSLPLCAVIWSPIIPAHQATLILLPYPLTLAAAVKYCLRKMRTQLQNEEKKRQKQAKLDASKDGDTAETADAADGKGAGKAAAKSGAKRGRKASAEAEPEATAAKKVKA